MAAEMFLQNARPLALSMCFAVNWLGNLFVGLVFPIMEQTMGDNAFLPFAVLALVELGFLVTFLPETNGIPCDEIFESFKHGSLLQACKKKYPERNIEDEEWIIVNINSDNQ